MRISSAILLALFFAINNRLTEAAKRKRSLRAHHGYPELVFKGMPNSSPQNFPLGLCKGACFSDEDCEDGLECFAREGTEAVVGCQGSGEPGVNYCYRRPRHDVVASNAVKTTPTPELVFKGAPGTDPENFPLALCEGGCFSNSHCQDDLVCFFRGGTEPVEGCIGTGESGTNYCHRPNPTLQQSTTPTTAPTLTTEAPTPVATQVNTIGAPTPMPTQTSTTAVPTLSPTSAPTTEPPDVTDLTIRDDSLKPFGKCVGECDDDNDCLGALRCQERGAFEFVPGCNGLGEEGKNFCYDPSDGPAPPALPSGSFRLRLYWQEGYFWQESTQETFWCLQHNGDGSIPVIKTCKSSSTNFEFVYLPGEGDQIKVSGTNQCLDRTGNTKITFQDCDTQDEFQRWKGNWPGQRFDIRSVTREGCISNHHHPKPDEEVFINPCSTAHLTDTGFWERF